MQESHLMQDLVKMRAEQYPGPNVIDAPVCVFDEISQRLNAWCTARTQQYQQLFMLIIKDMIYTHLCLRDQDYIKSP